jgi:hypothetical protein
VVVAVVIVVGISDVVVVVVGGGGVALALFLVWTLAVQNAVVVMDRDWSMIG